jgi:hypothetical protein
MIPMLPSFLFHQVPSLRVSADVKRGGVLLCSWRLKGGGVLLCEIKTAAATPRQAAI